MIKLRIATGIGLLLFTATMACSPVRMSQARANDGGDTLASLAGKFETRGSGSYTACFTASLPETESFSAVDCASAPHQEVRFNVTAVSHATRDAAGNSCAVTTLDERILRYVRRNILVRTNVSTTTSFDPTTGSGSSSFSQYYGGRCIGAAFDSTGAILTDTGTQSFMVSDSGNRIDTIVTSFSVVTSPFGVPGMLKETMPVIKATSIRESD